MQFVQIIGLVAGFCTTIAFLPQVIKTYKSKSAKDLSSGMFLTFCTGLILWLVYGVMVDDVPIIMANFLTLIMASIILVLKVKYRNQ